jgi:phage terminase small subunit
MDDDIEHLGPAMRALNPRQRRFVQIYVDDPRKSASEVSREAGYSSRIGADRVQAHYLMHSPKVRLALREELTARFAADAALARRVMVEEAQDRTSPFRLKAAQALADRGGFAVVTQQHHIVEHREETAAEKVLRITHLAQVLGVDPAVLLGANTPAAPMKTIEHASRETPTEGE